MSSTYPLRTVRVADNALATAWRPSVCSALQRDCTMQSFQATCTGIEAMMWGPEAAFRVRPARGLPASKICTIPVKII